MIYLLPIVAILSFWFGYEAVGSMALGGFIGLIVASLLTPLIKKNAGSQPTWVFRFLTWTNIIHKPNSGGVSKHISNKNVSSILGTRFQSRKTKELLTHMLLDLVDTGKEFQRLYLETYLMASSEAEVRIKAVELLNTIINDFTNHYPDRVLLVGGKLINTRGLVYEYLVDRIQEVAKNSLGVMDQLEMCGNEAQKTH